MKKLIMIVALLAGCLITPTASDAFFFFSWGNNNCCGCKSSYTKCTYRCPPCIQRPMVTKSYGNRYGYSHRSTRNTDMNGRTQDNRHDYDNRSATSPLAEIESMQNDIDLDYDTDDDSDSAKDNSSSDNNDY